MDRSAIFLSCAHSHIHFDNVQYLTLGSQQFNRGLATRVGVKCGTVGPVFFVAADISDLTGVTTLFLLDIYYGRTTFDWKNIV